MKHFLLFLVLFVSNAWSALSPKQTLENLLRAKILDAIPQASRVEIKSLFFRGKIPPDAQIMGLHPEVPMGQVQAEVLWTEKGETQQALITAVVKVYAKILVASQNLQANDPFTSANTVMEERELSSLRVSGFYTDWKDLEEYRARGFISHGTVIGQLQIAKPVLVNPGQMIDLIYSKRNVTISAKVKALEKGTHNQWIRVENPSTKKIIQGRVVEFGRVSIH